jgi:hypothetical protein
MDMRLATTVLGVALAVSMGTGCTAPAAQSAAQESPRAGVEQEQPDREAAARVALARASVAEAQSLFAAAPTGKGTRADLAAIREDLTAAATLLAQAEAALEASRFDEATAKAASAVGAADTVKRAIEQAGAIRAFRPGTGA